MTVRVIVPPEPIVTPGDINGDHAAGDEMVAAIIAAAQESIDGPTGWLGRSLGVQTLEYRGNCLPCRLPLRPIIEVQAVTVDGEAATLPAWREDGTLTWPASARGGDVVITYRAGYNSTMVAEGGTGDVPERARHAIILMVQGLMAAAKREDLRSFEVHDAYTKQFSSPELLQRCRTAAVDALLSGLRVYV